MPVNNDKDTFWKDTVILHINTENTHKWYFEEKAFSQWSSKALYCDLQK